jgi:hypothetical protein
VCAILQILRRAEKYVQYYRYSRQLKSVRNTTDIPESRRVCAILQILQRAEECAQYYRYSRVLQYYRYSGELKSVRNTTDETWRRPRFCVSVLGGVCGGHSAEAQCSAVQCSAVQCSAVQCSAVQCSAVQCSVAGTAVRCPDETRGAGMPGGMQRKTVARGLTI